MTQEKTQDTINLKSIKDEYFNYLTEDVLGPTHNGKLYSILYYTLNNIEFYAKIERDKNRAESAYTYRMIFLQLYKEKFPKETASISSSSIGDIGFSYMPSFFEVVIYLAKDLAYITDGSTDTKYLSKWFWIMMENLGLESYWDGNTTDSDINIIKATVRRVLDRDYDENGVGGLFPLRETSVDQRKTELWYQANYFLVENNLV